MILLAVIVTLIVLGEVDLWQHKPERKRRTYYRVPDMIEHREEPRE